ncbi:hypothetical protein OROGR_011998 [Orobanche gracilis]
MSYVTDEPLQMELNCVTTTRKGRGMTSSTDILASSLVQKEYFYAAILLKCQTQAGGQYFSTYKNEYGSLQDFSHDLVQYIKNVSHLTFQVQILNMLLDTGMNAEVCIGVQVTLAGCILVNQNKILMVMILQFDLCQNYGRLSAETKLEFHGYSLSLLRCLQKCYASKLSSESAITSEVDLIVSCFLKCSDGKQPLAYDATSSMEQVGKSDCSERHNFLEDRYSFICQCNGCT